MTEGWLLLVAVVAGCVGALSGLGGGVVLIPFLIACGIDIKHAIATSVVSVVALSISAASNYVQGHLANLKVSAFLDIFAVTGALAGAAFAVLSTPRVLFLVCGVTLLLSCYTLWKQRRGIRGPRDEPDHLAQTLELKGGYYDYAQRKTLTYAATRASLGGPCMFGAGLIAGLLGIGGSAFTVLVQELVMGLPPKVAVATSNLIIGTMALAGASVYLEAGLLEPRLVAPATLGVYLGALIGSWALIRLTNQIVQRIFLLLLPVLGVEMFLHALRGF